MPPVEPRPSTGGAPKTPIVASWKASNFRRNSAAMRRPCSSGSLLPLFERLEDHEHAAHVADVRAQERGIAGHGDHVGDALGFQGDLAELGHEAVRAFQARAVGKLHVDDQIALVLIGDEALGHDLEAQAGHGQQPAVDHQQDERHAEQAADQEAVAAGEPVEDPVEAAQELVEQRS